MLLVPYMHYVCSWYVWCHWALVAESRLPLKMVAGTFVQMGSVRAQVDQQFHMFICFYKWSIMSVWSRCMWVEYCLRMWRDKYSICVLERETKSCVAVYVEMPGVNKNPPTGTSEPDTIWRHASCSLQVERKSSVCEPPQPVTSLSLFSHALIISPVYIHEAVSLYHRSSFLLHAVSTLNRVGSRWAFLFFMGT